MANVLVHVVFSGLIALVPEGSKNDMKVTALLVDAQSPPAASDGCPIHPHRPVLYFKKIGSCGDCEQKRDLCACQLSHMDISLLQSSTGCGATGGKPCDVSALDLVANMPHVKNKAAKVDRKFMGENPPDALVGRFLRLPVNDTIEVVKKVGQSLLPNSEQAVEPKSVDNQVMSFEFRSLVYRTWFPHTPPELAEIVLIPTLAPYIEEEGRKVVKVTRRSFDPRGGERVVSVPVESCGQTGEFCAYVYISNEMSEFHEKGSCGELDIGRHFELFYQLSSNRVWSNEKPVPFLKIEKVEGAKAKAKLPTTTPASDLDLQFVDNVLRDARGGENRPICPMTVISQ